LQQWNSLTKSLQRHGNGLGWIPWKQTPCISWFLPVLSLSLSLSLSHTHTHTHIFEVSSHWNTLIYVLSL
jgi:hypothetical protein